MWRVVREFTDSHDGGHRYREGDAYPRDGASPGKERTAELSGSDNARGVPLIEREKPSPRKK